VALDLHPPNYDRNDHRYPVLYLLHGNGEAQDGWVMNGRANIILDNLIADSKAQTMLVVMPQGHALQGAGTDPLVRTPGETTMFSDRFPKDLLEEVIPLVESNYRVISDADNSQTGASGRLSPPRNQIGGVARSPVSSFSPGTVPEDFRMIRRKFSAISRPGI